MSPHVLTINAGSSSIKFAVYETPGQTPELALDGQVDRIGAGPRIRAARGGGAPLAGRDLTGADAADHAGALAAILDLIGETLPGIAIGAVGHRVVNGGRSFAEPVLVDARVMEELERLAPFAPLHQPHNLAGIRAAAAAFPEALQVACFDTAFHRNHPFVNDVFALPREYYDKGVRRYGFHGLSYEYISGELARTAPHLHSGRVIVAHLGNGASMCGMIGGRSIASTMGFTALDGLPMGTRCGQLDPGVILYMLQTEGLSPDEVADILYRRSGLLGLSGISNDMRTLEESGSEDARRAIDYFVFRIRREIGALAASLGGLDALVFTGGIGENSGTIRAAVCADMAWLGLEIDAARNEAGERVISTGLGRVRVMVIPTDEERVIARAASGQMARSGGNADAPARLAQAL